MTVVNTDVMGPGYQSAYGLVMGDPHRSQAGRVRQPDPHARLGRLHVDRAPLLARLPPAGEQPRRAAVRLRAAAPPLPARRRRPAELEEAARGRRRDVPIPAHDARLLLRARRADSRRRARGPDHGRREEADHGVRAQAGRRLRGRQHGRAATRPPRRRSRRPGVDRSPRPDAGSGGRVRARRGAGAADRSGGSR